MLFSIPKRLGQAGSEIPSLGSPTAVLHAAVATILATAYLPICFEGEFLVKASSLMRPNKPPLGLGVSPRAPLLTSLALSATSLAAPLTCTQKEVKNQVDCNLSKHILALL